MLGRELDPLVVGYLNSAHFFGQPWQNGGQILHGVKEKYDFDIHPVKLGFSLRRLDIKLDAIDSGWFHLIGDQADPARYDSWDGPYEEYGYAKSMQPSAVEPQKKYVLKDVDIDEFTRRTRRRQRDLQFSFPKIAELLPNF